MSSTMTPKPESHTTAEQWCESGRLVVHTKGADAGLIRLDLEVRGFKSAEEACRAVKLIFVGESQPLSARHAVGNNGRFVLGYYSGEIANGGYLPGEAVACWEIDGQQHRMKVLFTETATKALTRGGVEAANIPGGMPSQTYPKAVSLLVLLASGCFLAFAILLLIL
ncbi:MAG: hypothetical protein KDA91_07035 [Planctomycetaceae bacterium]|nr:hypothetical protein [Planctomycetaceae bacterium]